MTLEILEMMLYENKQEKGGGQLKKL